MTIRAIFALFFTLGTRWLDQKWFFLDWWTIIYRTAYCESGGTYLICPLVTNEPLIMSILAILAIIFVISD